MEFRLQVFLVQRENAATAVSIRGSLFSEIELSLFFSLASLRKHVLNFSHCESVRVNQQITIQRMNAIDKYYMHVNVCFYFTSTSYLNYKKRSDSALGQITTVFGAQPHF